MKVRYIVSVSYLITRKRNVFAWERAIVLVEIRCRFVTSQSGNGREKYSQTDPIIKTTAKTEDSIFILLFNINGLMKPEK